MPSTDCGSSKAGRLDQDEELVETVDRNAVLLATGVVLLCNVRGIGLLTCDPSFQRERAKPVPPNKRVLEKTVDLWSAVNSKQKVDPTAVEDLVTIITARRNRSRAHRLAR